MCPYTVCVKLMPIKPRGSDEDKSEIIDSIIVPLTSLLHIKVLIFLSQIEAHTNGTISHSSPKDAEIIAYCFRQIKQLGSSETKMLIYLTVCISKLGRHH